MNTRLGLDVVFGLFLINGLMICATLVAALVAVVSKEGDPWLAVFALGMTTFLPSLVAWAAGAIRSFMRPRDSEVRLGTLLATLQLLLWAGLVALGRFSSISNPSGWLLVTPMLVTAFYGVVVTGLALRWFFYRRRRFSPQVAPADRA